MTYFSDLVVAFLRQQDIDYVSFNPGASFRGIHDSLVHAENAPSIVMCCHEEIAVAVAHGYHKASGRHMAVLIHANVGLLHASMAFFNAWCDRVPLFVIGGNGPLDARERRPWIDWIHTSQNIGEPVADFVKWWDQPIGQWSTMESLTRAFRLMSVGTPAPVYVAIDFDVQEQVLDKRVTLPAKSATEAPCLPPIGEQDVADLAERLLSARMPVLIVDFAGRDSNTIGPLRDLVETAGCAVIDRGNRFNLPSTHPQNLSNIDPGLIAQADVILAIEVQDLFGALKSFLDLGQDDGPTNGTFLATLGCNDLLTSKWAADYQQFVAVDRALIGDSAESLKALAAAVRLRTAQSTADAQEARRSRIGAISKLHQTARAAWKAEARADGGSGPMSVAAAVDAIGSALAGHDVVVANTGSLTIDGWVRRLWALERPGCHLGLNGGGGLGYGLGASIGAALAIKGDGRLALDLQADGDLLYTPSGLWTLSAYGVPLLVIVMNNRLYLNSKQHAVRIARNRNRDEEKADIATSFHENPVDFVGLARSFNVHAFPRVETIDQVIPTVRAAAELVRTENRPVVVELLTL